MVELAVIGGTGVYTIDGLADARTDAVSTPFSGTPVALVRGRWRGQEVAFLARHGEGHAVLPHAVDYRANVWALAQLAPRRVIALNTVGSLDDRLPPGALGIPDQLIDYTWGREGSYWGALPDVPMHVDLTEPYDRGARASLIEAAGSDAAATEALVYAATQGPRLETAAEVRRLGNDGCSLVGMTGMPEAALARELGLRYASLCIVANWAAGFRPDVPEISLEEVLAIVAGTAGRAWAVLERLLHTP